MSKVIGESVPALREATQDLDCLEVKAKHMVQDVEFVADLLTLDLQRVCIETRTPTTALPPAATSTTTPRRSDTARS